MQAGPFFDSYEWARGREPLLRFGDGEPLVALALPLFEEANRTRALGVSILRALAERGIAGALPELPAQGESETPTTAVRIADLCQAFAAAPGRYAVAIRSGALLVGERPCWLLSPQNGPALLRELARIKGAPLDGDPVEVAGNLLSASLVHDLSIARLPDEGRGPVPTSDVGQPAPSAASPPGPGLGRGGVHLRTVRLSSDNGTADRHVDGPALWRRAEPGNDPGLAQSLAADIADWLATCAV